MFSQREGVRPSDTLAIILMYMLLILLPWLVKDFLINSFKYKKNRKQHFFPNHLSFQGCISNKKFRFNCPDYLIPLATETTISTTTVFSYLPEGASVQLLYKCTNYY